MRSISEIREFTTSAKFKSSRCYYRLECIKISTLKCYSLAYVVGPRVYVNMLDVRKIFGDEWYNCSGLVPDVPGASVKVHLIHDVH